MPITGYIIEKYNKMTNAYTCNRLVEEAKKLNIDLRIVGIHDTMILKDEILNNNVKLEKRDFVINRYKWGNLKDEINSLATRSYNPLDAYNIYINKYEQVKRLHSDEFLVPKYLLGTALLKYEDIAQQLGTPFVAKGLESSMGEQISLIEKPEDMQELYQKYGMEKII